MPIECTAILFDLDGVLIDSTQSITHLWEQWAQRHDLDLGAIMQVAYGRRAVDTIRLVAPQLAAEQEAHALAALEVADLHGVVVIDGAAPLLMGLPAGTWAIVTSGARAVVTARLQSLGLPLPTVLVTAEDVVKGKPDPEPYLAAAARLGVAAAHCVVIEDSPAGIAAALAAGMRAVGVASTHAVPELASATAIARHLADLQVDRGSDGGLEIRIVDPEHASSTGRMR